MEIIMAFVSDASTYFAGYSVLASGATITGTGSAGDHVVIPVSSLVSIDAGGGNTDVNEFLYSVLEGYADQNATVVAAGSGSTQVSVSRSSTIPNDSTIRRSYTVTVNLDFPDTTVKAG
jgi:hypothetical protein